MPEPIGVPYSEMPPTELDAAAAKALGMTPEQVAKSGISWSTDLDEAVKIPGFRELSGRDDRWCAYFLVDGQHYGRLADKPARAVVLAFLAACEGKQPESTDA